MAGNDPDSTDTGHSPRADYRPVGTDGRTSGFATLKRTLTEFSEDNLGAWDARH